MKIAEFMKTLGPCPNEALALIAIGGAKRSFEELTGMSLTEFD